MQHTLRLLTQPDSVAFCEIMKLGCFCADAILSSYRCSMPLLSGRRCGILNAGGVEWTENGKLGTIVDVSKLGTGSNDSSEYLPSNSGADLLTEGERSTDMNLNVIEGIDQGDQAGLLAQTKLDEIARDENELSTLVLNAPITMLHQMDSKAAKDSSSSTAVGKSEKKWSSC